MKKSTVLQLLRVLLCGISFLLLSAESNLWWLPVLPWAVLCLHGILLTIPLALVAGLGAGAAQADWMSDEWILTLCLIIPTGFSLALSFFFRRMQMFSPRAPSKAFACNLSQEE